VDENQEILFTLDELLEVFRFLGNANHLFHQPMYYEDSSVVEKFADDNYMTIHKLYYETIWNKLPKSIQDEFTEK
jgi:hypothetical protein